MKPAKFIILLLICAIPVIIATFGFKANTKKDHWKHHKKSETEYVYNAQGILLTFSPGKQTGTTLYETRG